MGQTLIEVDRGSPEPLYRQIRRALEHGIAVGEFDPRHRLPSSREIADELSVSRNIVNLAYQELIAEGFVEARERSGMFVNAEMRAYGSQRHPANPGRVDWNTRMRRYQDAEIPHIDKRADWFTYPYPFLAGQVDVHAFPARAWLRCLREALYQPHVHHSVQDAVGSDDPMLLDMICRHLLPARGIRAEPDQMLITLGAQEGLDLLARTLLGPNSVVAMEDPGYLDARHIFVRNGAHILGLPVDGSGLCPPATLTDIDLVCVTPSHHHPTNVTLSIARRRRLLHLAGQSGTVVIEDDYDSEFRYQGRPSPALKALDETGHVVYLGTFSKFLSPGLRIGYLVGAPELICELRQTRRYTHRHPPGHLQRALALLIESGEYQRSLRRYREQLAHKWRTVCDAVNTHLPWQISPPPGGVSLWMTGPPALDCRTLVTEAERAGVLIERGDIFFLAPDPPRNHFRIGFAAAPLRSITPGIRVLGEIIHRQLG